MTDASTSLNKHPRFAAAPRRAVVWVAVISDNTVSTEMCVAWRFWARRQLDLRVHHRWRIVLRRLLPNTVSSLRSTGLFFRISVFIRRLPVLLLANAKPGKWQGSSSCGWARPVRPRAATFPFCGFNAVKQHIGFDLNFPQNLIWPGEAAAGPGASLHAAF